MNGLDLPQALITLFGRAAFRQYAHLVTLADGSQRQLHRLRAVAFKVQTKRQPRGEQLELTFEIGAQL